MKVEKARQMTDGARFRALVEGLDAIVWEAEADSLRFTYVSPRAVDILGYPIERWLEEDDFWANLIHPEDHAEAVGLCRTASREGRDHELEYRALAADGRVVHLRDIVRVRDDPITGQRTLRGVMVDVTESKIVEERLEESQSHLDLVLGQIPAVYWSSDEDLRITSFGGAAVRPLNQSRDPVGMTIEEYWRGNEHGVVSLAAHESALRGEASSYEALRGGRVFACRVEPFRDREGSIKGVLGLAIDITEERRSEQALRASEERFRSIVETTSEWIWEFDAHGDFLFSNPGAEDLIGWRPDELMGRSCVDLVHPDDRSQVEALFEDALARGVGWSGVDMRVLHKDGGFRWLECNAVPVRGKEGEVVAFRGTGRDVTERRKSALLMAREADILELVARDAPLRNVLESINKLVEEQSEGTICSILLLDEEGRRLYHGAASGLPEEYVEAIDGIEIGPGVGSCGTAAYLRRMVVVTDIEADPRWEPFRDVALRSGLRACWSTPILSPEKGEVLGTFAIYYPEPRGPRPEEMDLVQVSTHLASMAIDRRRSIDAIRQSSSLLRSTLESTEDGIVVLDRAGRVVTHNRRFLQLWGVSEEDVAGKTGTEIRDLAQRLLAKPEQLDEIIEFSRRVPDLSRTDCLALRDGRRIEQRSQPRYLDGELVGRVLGFRDVTKSMSLEAQLQQAQKMEAVGRLAGGIAHDFNNLLSIVINSARLLEERMTREDPRRADADNIIQAGERGTALVRQLLAFSRQQPSHPRVLDLNETILGFERLLRATLGESIDLTFDLDPGLWRIKTDPAQIEQILLNLGINSRDAMPQGGELVITTRNLPVEIATSRTSLAPGRYVRVSVRDTGSGIDPDAQGKIFEPFFSTKGATESSGLGLSTVYGIVRQQRGDIWIDSTSSGGTTLTMCLPASDQPLAFPLEVAEEATEPTSAGATVLVVEDEEGVLEVTERILRREGFRVVATSTPAQALEALYSASEAIELILTDVTMPGMSGLQLVERARRVLPDVKVVLMSGYLSEMEMSEDGRDAVFLPKPFNREELLAALEAARGPREEPAN